MNSELASNDIRQAIYEAVRRYHTPHPKGATHIDKFGCYYKYELGSWYEINPFKKQWCGIWDITSEQIKALGIEKL